MPEVGDNDVLVQVISTGICGSDAHVWASNPATPPPVLGHESAGVISRIGGKVKDRSVGMRVAVEPGFACMMYVCVFFFFYSGSSCEEVRTGEWITRKQRQLNWEVIQ